MVGGQELECDWKKHSGRWRLEMVSKVRLYTDLGLAFPRSPARLYSVLGIAPETEPVHEKAHR